MQQKKQDEGQKERRNKGNVPAQEPLGERIEEEVEHIVEEAQEEVAVARKPWYQTRKWGFILLTIDTILLALFAFLAIWVAYHPVLAIDVTITRDFQANQSPWLRYTMLAASYIGNVMALSAGLVVLAAILFWILDLRLEAIMVVVVSATSDILNSLIKLIVARPRPSASLVEIIQAASGNSFPSGHVMSYVAFWGLLFSFGPLQRKTLVAYRVADYFCAVFCACRSFTHLPWRSLGQRCTGRLPHRRHLACYVPVALSVFKRQRCACPQGQAGQAFSSKICKTSRIVTSYATLKR